MSRLGALWIVFGLSLALPVSPAMALGDMQGRPAAIESLVGQGKWSIFELWASDCITCRETIHETIHFSQAHPEVNVYGIALDGMEGKAAAEQFIAEMEVPFPNFLSDPPEMDSYMYTHARETFLGTPTFLVFNPQGGLVAVQPGDVTEEELNGFIQGGQAGRLETSDEAG